MSDQYVTPPYQNYPLNPSSLEIRLLTLEPAVSWEDDIHCTLTVANLQDLPQFEALSYTWDGGFNTETIKLSNIPYLITPNLKSFLLHHRLQTEAVELWVDAICINQSSDPEKSSQVRIMNMIYAVATKLMVWLGPEGDESSLAMEELQRLGAGSPYEKMPILGGSVLMAIKKLLTRGWWSRVWIIQEVFYGGLGRKVQHIRVRCGTKEVYWVNLVTAAARMQAHADDQRQHYPAIENILSLERNRIQGELLVTNVANEMVVMDLVAMHRHFQATDPRDKIYALMGMVFGEKYGPFPAIRVDYSMNTRKLYMDFATMALQNGSGLEFLRHCRSSAVEMLPSWVPDWSIGRVEKPLPSRKISGYEKEPWWSRLKESKDDSGEQDSPVFIEEGPGKGLRLNTGLPGDIQLNAIPRCVVDLSPPGILDDMKELMDSGRLVGLSTNGEDEDEVISKYGHKTMDDVRARTIARSERRTRNNIQLRNKAFPAGPMLSYAAAGDTTPEHSVDHTTNTLEVEGILFDVIDQTHDPFVDSLDAAWENSTHFMLAISQCKQLAISKYKGQNPYNSDEARVEAFWITLFAGRVIDNSGAELGTDELRFHEWLPLIPTAWVPALPRVTVTNTGRLEVGEMNKSIESMLSEPKTGYLGHEFRTTSPSARVLSNLQPEEWTDKNLDDHTTKFQQLSALWLQQPFDLYHRPFALPYVIPDPFWETRQTEDKVALL